MFGRPNAAVLLLLLVVAAALVIPGSARPGEDSETSSERSSKSSKSMSKNPCAVDPCNSNGRCIELKKDFVCDCDCGYAGEFCEQNVDDCEGTPCGEHGNCTDGVASFTCECDLGFDGTLCENNINDCVGNPCQYGDCLDGVNEYLCTCHEGFTGVNCETNSDDCANDPCHSNGRCIDLINNFECDCDRGYAGKFCQENDACYGGATLTAPSGVVQSHFGFGVGEPYADNLTCSWSIEVAEGMAVRLTFTVFNVQLNDGCTGDRVRIYDGSSFSRLLGTYCGFVLFDVPISTGRRMYITFDTDELDGFMGFQFNWESVQVSQ